MVGGICVFPYYTSHFSFSTTSQKQILYSGLFIWQLLLQVSSQNTVFPPFFPLRCLSGQRQASLHTNGVCVRVWAFPADRRPGMAPPSWARIDLLLVNKQLDATGGSIQHACLPASQHALLLGRHGSRRSWDPAVAGKTLWVKHFEFLIELK